MYASNVKMSKKRFLGKVIHCISAKKHILRYMLVGCSRILSRDLKLRIYNGQSITHLIDLMFAFIVDVILY